MDLIRLNNLGGNVIRRFVTLVLVFCMICTFAACGSTSKNDDIEADMNISRNTDPAGPEAADAGDQQALADGKYFTATKVAGFALAGNDTGKEAFEDVAPMYNIPDGHEFKIKLNWKDGLFAHGIADNYFKIFMDRECTKEVKFVINYDENTGYVSLEPHYDSFFVNSYPREGIEKAENDLEERIDMNTWGSLKTYYLVVYADTSADTFKMLDKPRRMMFTIAAAIDSPTVKTKINKDGNVTLYWDSIEGAESYKIYHGTFWLMRELAQTDKTEFVLHDGYEYGMNGLLSGMSEYAVVAVKGEEESRLSNLIDGEDYAKNAPKWISSDEQQDFDADKVSILDLPREIDIQMVDLLTYKTYPVIWDLRNPDITDYGMYVYYGKIPGTTLSTTYRCAEDELPTAEEIEAFYKEVQPSASVAEDNTDKISIPNSPSVKEVPTETTEEIVIDIAEKSEKENELSLEQAIALGMLNHETTIDLSAYPQAGDPAYLRDVLQMVLSQCVLILDEESVTFDFKNQMLNVKYGLTQEESLAKQLQILEKADEVIKAVIRDGMSIEEKEKVLHDWIADNGQYHDEVLQAYYDGVDLGEISNQYADSFSVYGILVNGLGVCQSYAETYKLLCDLAEVPSIVATGTMGSVPHAWNKVLVGNQWYNVDITNNDGNILPYPVYNSSDHMLKKHYSEGLAHVLDIESSAYASPDDSQDYYYIAGMYSKTSGELKQLITEQLSSTNEFYIKTSPDLTDEEIVQSLIQAIDDLGLRIEDIMTIYNLNILGVKKAG